MKPTCQTAESAVAVAQLTVELKTFFISCFKLETRSNLHTLKKQKYN